MGLLVALTHLLSGHRRPESPFVKKKKKNPFSPALQRAGPIHLSKYPSHREPLTPVSNCWSLNLKRTPRFLFCLLTSSLTCLPSSAQSATCYSSAAAQTVKSLTLRGVLLPGNRAGIFQVLCPRLPFTASTPSSEDIFSTFSLSLKTFRLITASP